jgi:hypothetical protein
MTTSTSIDSRSTACLLDFRLRYCPREGENGAKYKKGGPFSPLSRPACLTALFVFAVSRTLVRAHFQTIVWIIRPELIDLQGKGATGASPRLFTACFLFAGKS